MRVCPTSSMNREYDSRALVRTYLSTFIAAVNPLALGGFADTTGPSVPDRANTTFRRSRGPLHVAFTGGTALLGAAFQRSICF